MQPLYDTFFFCSSGIYLGRNEDVSLLKYGDPLFGLITVK